MIGERYGRWTVRSAYNGEYVVVVCDCGTQKIVKRRVVAAGKSKSCGCLRRELGRETVSRCHTRNTRPIAERLLEKVEPEPTSGCWLWTGAEGGGGYGIIGSGPKLKKAHRVAWEVFRGPIADGLTIDHLCRVRMCVNPQHLEPVTLAENLARARAAKLWEVRREALTLSDFIPQNIKTGAPVSDGREDGGCAI